MAVPSTAKEKFVEHSRKANSVFIELGATRVVDCWGDDVPEGEVTDFRKAVQAKADETIVFSWVELPDKATRDQANARMEELMRTDERFKPETNPMPFDGRRVILGGFAPVLEL